MDNFNGKNVNDLITAEIDRILSLISTKVDESTLTKVALENVATKLKAVREDYFMLRSLKR